MVNKIDINMDLLSQKLEIIIITFNRSKRLSETLSQLVKSPFSGCKIIVLDNCSNDDTYNIFTRFETDFKNINYHKNKVNIGGDANIIRAVETSNGIYTWILCDDDNFDFSYCDDVIDKICKSEVSLIHMGAHTHTPWKSSGEVIRALELFSTGYNYFTFSSFLPCNIFKTADFYEVIIQAYSNIRNMYPHMPLLIKIFENDEKLYVAQQRIVIANDAFQAYDTFLWKRAWLETCNLISDRKIRSKAFFSQFVGQPRYKITCSLVFDFFKGNLNSQFIFLLFSRFNWL